MDELLDSIREVFHNELDKGNIPDDWDGTEIRQFLQDMVSKKINYTKLRGDRLKKYKETTVYLNL